MLGERKRVWEVMVKCSEREREAGAELHDNLCRSPTPPPPLAKRSLQIVNQFYRFLRCVVVGAAIAILLPVFD